MDRLCVDILDRIIISIFFLVDLGFLMVAASYFTEADGHHTSAEGLKKAGGMFCFLAGLVGWYLTFQLPLKDSIAEHLDTSARAERKSKAYVVRHNVTWEVVRLVRRGCSLLSYKSDAS